MTDTFAFNAPPVSTHFAPLSNPLSHAAHPPYPAAGTAGYYPGSHPSSAPQGPAMSQNGAGGVAVSSSHHAGALVAVRGDGLEDEGRGEGVHNVVYGFRKEADGAGEAAGGISPGASAAPFGTNAFAHFPHYSNNSFKGNNNVRNTRPMTAPSSVSAPYFQGGLYSNPPHASTSSFYSVGMNSGLYSGGFNYHAPPPESLHGAMPPSTSEVEAYRARGFSLPELAGLPGDGRYAGGSAQRTMSVGGGGGSSGTFMYGPPPLATHDEHGRDGSSGEDSDPYSRPTTGDSRPNSAGNKRTRFGQGTSHRDPPGPNDPLRRYPYNGTSPGANGVDGGPTGSSFDSNPSKPYNFLSSQPEPVSKRPRRRFDEIERLYTCDYPGCQKAYGTLNHLNSHKTMQKHGPKSTPARASLFPPPVSRSCTDDMVPSQNSRSCVKHGEIRRRPPRPNWPLAPVPSSLPLPRRTPMPSSAAVPEIGLARRHLPASTTTLSPLPSPARPSPHTTLNSLNCTSRPPNSCTMHLPRNTPRRGAQATPARRSSTITRNTNTTTSCTRLTSPGLTVSLSLPLLNPIDLSPPQRITPTSPNLGKEDRTHPRDSDTRQEGGA